MAKKPIALVFVGLLSLALVAAQGDSKNAMSTAIHPKIAALDAGMDGYVRKIGCTAGVLAIGKNGQLLYSRGYGWLDKERMIPAPANAYIGIASCEKPITAAAVRKLAREGKFKLNAPLFETLRIRPAGRIVDPRVNLITFEHVLEHKAGWGGDIRGELTAAAKSAGAGPPFDVPKLLAYARSRPLVDEPGKVSKYSNFGFEAMRYAVWFMSKQMPGVYFRENLLEGSRCKEIGEPDELVPAQRKPRAVWNLAEGGPVFASAPYLCRFMDEYWLTGHPRNSGQVWVMYGSLPGSTTIMVWRPDGLNLAANFNGRNQTTHDEIKVALENAIDQTKPELLSPPPAHSGR
jgi:CubicO group peptidase (beta-lactamase class C family)